MELDHNQNVSLTVPCVVSITGTECGNYQNYIGLREKKWQTFLFNWHRIKKIRPSSLEKKNLLLNETFPHFVLVAGRKNRHFSTSLFPRKRKLALCCSWKLKSAVELAHFSSLNRVTVTYPERHGYPLLGRDT